MFDEGWSMEVGPASEYERAYVARNAPAPQKRKGMTPESRVAKAVDAYLKKLDFYVLRTSAGMAEIGGRKISIGRTGTHDRTCCKAGRYISIEIKSATGKPSEAQLRQRACIERRGGIVIIPHSVAELRAGLVAAFGEATVALWET